jgi:hypothetical protein
MAAPIAAATETESAAEHLRGRGENAAARLARVVPAMKRTATVAARLLRCALDDRHIDRRQPLKKLDS